MQTFRYTYISRKFTQCFSFYLLLNNFHARLFKMFCVEPHAFAEACEHCFLPFLSCKSSLIILFIVATDVFKDFAIDFCIGGFSLVTSIFILENFETVHSFFRYLFGGFFPCVEIMTIFPFRLIMLLIL